eukprot:m.157785 g.157785  ORF g.157785 m.157785 type:complete len:99 (-) comp31066_c0_seq1:50-346(-)
MGTKPIAQAQELSDRITAAEQFVNDTSFSWPIVCDSMENTFHHQFGAWPTRFYVLQDDKLAFKIELDATRMFDTLELRQWVENYAAAAVTVTSTATLG